MALETAAAIIGLIAAAGKVAEILLPVVSAFGDATKNAAAVLAEVNQMRTILSALNGYLDDLSICPDQRKQLIQVDQLVATLTDGVLLFSELEALVLRLQKGEDGSVNRMLWARNDGKFKFIKSRMQCFKSSITVMLNILQCESDREATRSRNDLLALTSVLLNSNFELSRRLAHLETTFDPGNSIHTYRPDSIMTIETVTQGVANMRMDTIAEDSSTSSLTELTDSQYEKILEASRVYRNAKSLETDASFRTSVIRSHAWTVLSDYSLSDISALSVIALPMFARDISNMQHYRFCSGSYKAESIIPTSDPDSAVVRKPHLPKALARDPMFIHPDYLVWGEDTNCLPTRKILLESMLSYTMNNLISKVTEQFSLEQGYSMWSDTLHTLTTSNHYVELRSRPHVDVNPSSASRTEAHMWVLIYDYCSPGSVWWLYELVKSDSWLKRRGHYPVFVIGYNNGTTKVLSNEGKNLAHSIGALHYEVLVQDVQSVQTVFSNILDTACADIKHNVSPGLLRSKVHAIRSK